MEKIGGIHTKTRTQAVNETRMPTEILNECFGNVLLL